MFDPSKKGLDVRFVFEALPPVVMRAVVACGFSGYPLLRGHVAAGSLELHEWTTNAEAPKG